MVSEVLRLCWGTQATRLWLKCLLIADRDECYPSLASLTGVLQGVLASASPYEKNRVTFAVISGSFASSTVTVRESQGVTRPLVLSESCLSLSQDDTSSLRSPCQVPSNSRTCAVSLITLRGCACIFCCVNVFLPSHLPLPPQLLWLFSST